MRKNKYPASLRSDRGTANLLFVGRNIPEQVDGFSGIGKNKRYLKKISDFIRFSAVKTF